MSRVIPAFFPLLPEAVSGEFYPVKGGVKHYLISLCSACLRQNLQYLLKRSFS